MVGKIFKWNQCGHSPSMVGLTARSDSSILPRTSMLVPGPCPCRGKEGGGPCQKPPAAAPPTASALHALLAHAERVIRHAQASREFSETRTLPVKHFNPVLLFCLFHSTPLWSAAWGEPRSGSRVSVSRTRGRGPARPGRRVFGAAVAFVRTVARHPQPASLLEPAGVVAALLHSLQQLLRAEWHKNEWPER